MKKSSSKSALADDAREVRRKLLTMHHRAHSGHLGSGLSSVDLLVYLYRRWLNVDDQLVLSKGHAASALYAVLHHLGKLSDEELASYYQDGTLFPAHPAAHASKEIVAATGSLGHGLPIAVGLAYAHRRLADNSKKVACLLSDGECNEGAIWEAALFASHHHLSNLLVVIDANGWQGFGRTGEVLNTEPLVNKWKAFGFEAREADGHDFASLTRKMAIPSAPSARPLCVISRTIKGKGVRAIEDTLASHYLPMTDEQFQTAMRELDER